MEGVNLTIILVPLLILFSSMDFKHTIIQWNCQGLKPNYNEVSLLISEYNPSVFCFQETFLKPDDNISLRGFNIYNYVHTDCLRPSGGASIFVKSSFPQRKIDLQTELQATAVSVTLDREITICFVYIPPSFSLNSQHLDNLLQQLPSPYILLGDFNGHNILWGGPNNDSIGELIVGHPEPEKKNLLAFLSTFWHPCSKCMLMCFKKDMGGCQVWKCPKVPELGQRSTECKFLYICQI